MRVNIYQQLDVSDEQGQQIADLLDGKVTKRRAKRDEMKQFIWEQGADWEAVLYAKWDNEFGDGTVEATDDDLIGDDLEDII